MFKDNPRFIIGYLYFFFMFILANILPARVGRENGLIEITQILFLLAGFYICLRFKSERLADWGGNKQNLLYGGAIYFFLLIMREINWGRALLRHPDGSFYEYSDMGLYGQLVHPMVGLLIILLLVCLWRSKVWKFLKFVKIPVRDFALLLLFIFMAWVAEKTKFSGFNGMVAEELAEFGAYMLMLRLLVGSLKAAVKK